MTIRLSSDGWAVIDTEYYLYDAEEIPPPPKGVFLCANIHTGTTIISSWNDHFGFTHWAPLPVFPKDPK